jgi:L-lactate permease
MDNWNIANKIANMLGIVFVAFSAVSALIYYEYYTNLYVASVPAKLLTLSILTAVLPFIVAAVVSFTVSAVISRGLWREEDEKKETQTEEDKKEEEAKQQAEFDAAVA